MCVGENDCRMWVWRGEGLIKSENPPRFEESGFSLDRNTHRRPTGCNQLICKQLNYQFPIGDCSFIKRSLSVKWSWHHDKGKEKLFKRLYK